MRKMLPLLILLVVVGTATAAHADQKVNRVVPAEPDGTVTVELLSGSVRFETWDRSEVEITGTIGDDIDELEVDASGRHVSIEIDIREGRRNIHDANAELLVRLPAGSRIEAETVSADVDVVGSRGPIEIESVSGTIRIDDATDEVEVATVSGDVRVTPGSTILSGSFATVSGDVEFDGSLHARGAYAFAAVSGNVTLALDGGESAEFEIETFSGNIVSDFGPEPERSSPYLPAKELRFSMGSGGARVTIESFSGRVKLRRR